MTRPLVFRVCKYLLMEKMVFSSMPNICFHDAQISWNNIFSITSQKIFLTMIKFSSPWRKMQLLTLAYSKKYCKSYFSTTQINCDYYGFTNIKSEAAVLSFPSYSCCEHCEKFRSFSKGALTVKQFSRVSFNFQLKLVISARVS